MSKQQLERYLPFLADIPDRLKEGPWHPNTVIVLFAFLSYLCWTVNDAHPNNANIHNNISVDFMPYLQSYRLLVGLYCLFVTSGTIVAIGFWPLTSYTVTSWNLMAVRLLSSYLGGLGKGV